MTNASRSRSVLVLLVVFLAVLVAFFDVLGTDRLLYNRDHIGLYRPYWEAVVESLRGGRWPSLTRGDTSGAPVEAYPLGIYTPVTLLFFLAPDLTTSWDLFIVAHYLLLAGGVFVLARSLGASAVAAGVAATIATLSGPVLSLENLTAHTVGLAYAPWAYAGFVRLLRTPSALWVALEALALGFHLQAPEPFIVVLDVIALVLLTATERPRLTGRRLLALSLAGALALGIAAATIMPVLELLALSRRGAGFSYAEASTRAFRLAQLPELIAPSFWTPSDKLFLNAPAVSGDPVGPLFYSSYFGVSLGLAPLALFAPVQRPLKWALFALLMGTFLVSLGAETPLHRWLWHLPILKNGRYPVKYLVIVQFLLAALGCLGIYGFRRAPRALIATSALCSLLTFVLFRVVDSAEFSAFLADVLRLHPEFNHQGLSLEKLPEMALASAKPRVMHGMLFSGLLLAMSIAASFLMKRGVRREAFECAFFGLLAVDLSTGAQFTIEGTSVESTKGPAEEITARLSEESLRYYPLLPSGRAAPIARDVHVTYFEDFVRSNSRRGHYLHGRVRRYEEFDRNGLSDPIATLSFNLLGGLRGDEALALLARAGVGWVGSWVQIPGNPPAFQVEVEGESPEYFTRVPNVRPYAGAYGRWREIDGAAASTESIRKILTESKMATEAIVWSHPGPSPPSPDPSCSDPAKVQIERSSEVEHVDLVVRGACPSVIVIVETVMPGWIVRVDGAEVPLLHAELGFLGAWVAPGEHHVRFEYQPKVRRWAPVSLFCFTVALGLMWLGRGNIRSILGSTRARK